MRVWFNIDRISHRLDAVEDDLDAVLIPVVREVEEWVEGRLTQQEGRVVHTHRGVLWVLDDGRTSCNQPVSQDSDAPMPVTVPFKWTCENLLSSWHWVMTEPLVLYNTSFVFQLHIACYLNKYVSKSCHNNNY